MHACELQGRRLASGGKHEFIGAHGSSDASHLPLANIADHESAEAFVLKQARRGLREEDLPALGRVAELVAA